MDQTNNRFYKQTDSEFSKDMKKAHGTEHDLIKGSVRYDHGKFRDETHEEFQKRLPDLNRKSAQSLLKEMNAIQDQKPPKVFFTPVRFFEANNDGQKVYVYGRVNIGSEHECFEQFPAIYYSHGFCDEFGDMFGSSIEVTHVLV